MKRTSRTATAALVAVLLSAALAATLNAQGIKQQFEHVVARALTVQGAATLNADLTVADDLTVGDAVTATSLDAATVIADVARLTPATAISVTQGLTITAAGSYQPLESAGNVSTGAITAGAAGDVLILANQANTTITISDTGTLKLSGNLALGQYDSVTLISDGANWIQAATSNN